MPKSTITPQRQQIAASVNRLLEEVDPAADPKPIIDLIETVARKNRLNVARWESFPLGDLGHDIYGIIRHIVDTHNAVADMIEALDKIALESKHNIRTWTELDYQDAMSAISKIAQAALRKAGQIE